MSWHPALETVAQAGLLTWIELLSLHGCTVGLSKSSRIIRALGKLVTPTQVSRITDDILPFAKQVVYARPIMMPYGPGIFCQICVAGQLETAKWLSSHNPHMLRPVPGGYSDMIVAACRNGHINVVKWLDSQISYVWNPQDPENAFNAAGWWGHREMAQWIHSKWPRVIPPAKQWEEKKFVDTFQAICVNGHVDIAQWVLDQCPDAPSLKDYVFELICAKGDLKTAKWMRDTKQPHGEIHSVVCEVCRNGHLAVLVWLRSNNMFPANLVYPLRIACAGGHLEVAQWLYAVDPSAMNNMLESRVNRKPFTQWALGKKMHLPIIHWILDTVSTHYSNWAFSTDTNAHEWTGDDEVNWALDRACMCGDLPLVKLIITKYNDKINVWDNKYSMLRSSRKHLPVLSWLCERYSITCKVAIKDASRYEPESSAICISSPWQEGNGPTPIVHLKTVNAECGAYLSKLFGKDNWENATDWRR